MSIPHYHETSELRPVDRQLLLALRGGEPLGVEELTRALGVTATAVRQRIERLLELGLLEREKRVAGRGRPTYRYRLSLIGYQRAGANPSELADAMWREILAFPDHETRERLIESVAARLGRRFAVEVAQRGVERDPANAESAASVPGRGEPNGAKPWTDAGRATSVAERQHDVADTFDERMRNLSHVLASRQIESEVSRAGELPVLDIGACPYPSLTDTSEDRTMCRLEEKMFSEALGHPMQLSQCRLDGDACCQFSPARDPDSTAAAPS